MSSFARPVEPHRRLTRQAAAALLTLGCAVTFLAGCGANRAYVNANKALLDTIPVNLNAVEIRRDSNPYYRGESEEIDGYTTDVVYGVSNVSDADVVEFYIDAMGSEWEYCREDMGVIAITDPPGGASWSPSPAPGDGQKIKLVHFLRGHEFVSVNTDGLFRVAESGTYELVVDHDTKYNPCTGADIRD